MKQPMIDTMMKEKFDNLYTPESAMLPLLKYIPNEIMTVWECCDPGTLDKYIPKSNITKVLRECGYYTKSSDITTGYDFLKETATVNFDMIITNPPYSLKDKFLEKCFSYGRPFALLLPLTALEGIKRGEMFSKYGISLIVLNKRLDFTGKGSNWFNTSWFTWGILPNNSLVFEGVE
jgi:hypothetical protein